MTHGEEDQSLDAEGGQPRNRVPRLDRSPSDYFVPGVLRRDANSGYEIMRAAPVSTGSSWAISAVQIYVNLERLERAWLIWLAVGSAGGASSRGALRPLAPDSSRRLIEPGRT
jgi:hypothetical protein